MRICVVGKTGQLATALREEAHGVELSFLGRPACDLEQGGPSRDDLLACRPDVLVNAAAYTAVDMAESEPERASQVNAIAVGRLGELTRALAIPMIHVSTDYVFDGGKASPYVESDPPSPISVYGATKLAGERALAAANPRHVILRTAWVYSHTGRNFVRTMLRLAAREEVRVVGDQIGNPTCASDLARAILSIAERLHRAPDSAPYGLYHLAAQGEASWADFAEAIFACSRRHGGPSARVTRISAADYPTAARRPANSRLDSSRAAAAFDVRLPNWRVSLDDCVCRLLETDLS